ncbi:MAG: sigma-70 family RNA polymerase sigma factor [Chloroflexota bacterium]
MAEERFELKGLRALDPQAIASIHHRYFPELYRYARFRLGDNSSAEDVASEAFVRLLEAVADGRGPESSLRGWLIGTAANLINMHFRRAYRRPQEQLSDELISDGPDPAASAEGIEQRHVLRRALRRLTPEQQHVLALRFGGGYSLEETAALMHKRPNAIKALQFRALAALRRGMEHTR